VITILTGDVRFSTPEFDDFQAEYNSSFSKTGRFSLLVRSFDGGLNPRQARLRPP